MSLGTDYTYATAAPGTATMYLAAPFTIYANSLQPGTHGGPGISLHNEVDWGDFVSPFKEIFATGQQSVKIWYDSVESNGCSVNAYDVNGTLLVSTPVPLNANEGSVTLARPTGAKAIAWINITYPSPSDGWTINQIDLNPAVDATTNDIYNAIANVIALPMASIDINPTAFTSGNDTVAHWRT